jgi:hypothetical protein
MNPARILGFKAQMMENAVKLDEDKKEKELKFALQTVDRYESFEVNQLNKTSDFNSVRSGIKNTTKNKLGNDAHRSEKS